MDGSAHLVHSIHIDDVDLERWWCAVVVGRRIGLECDPVGAIDPEELAIGDGSLPLGHDLVLWPNQEYLVAVLDHAVLWPSATFEPPELGGLFVELQLPEELLRLMQRMP